MSLESCIRSAREWLKENSDVELNAKELEQVGAFLQRAEELGATPAQKNEMMARVVEQKLAADQAKTRAKNYLDVISTQKSVAQVVKNIADWTEKGTDRNKAPVTAFMSRITGGGSKPGAGTNLDIQYLEGTVRNDYLQKVRVALGEDAKLLEGLDIKSTMSRDIYLEKSAIENGRQIGQTNNDTALRIAKAIHAIQNYTLTDVKAVNPYVMEAKNFLVSRVHDRDLIVAAGKSQWVQDAMQHFAGSFLGMNPQEKLATFSNIFDQIKAGSYGLSDMWEPTGTTGNQARVRAPSRSLVATDAMHEWQYASKYGIGLWENVLKQVDSQARDVARFQKWGPSPVDNFEREYMAIRKTLDEEQKAAFDRAKPKFKEAFDATMGRQDNVAYGMAARFIQGGLSWQSAVGLGAHVPRSLNGVASAVALARDAFGKTLPENAIEISAQIVKAMTPYSGAREAVEALGGVLRETARDMIGELRPTESKPGFAAKTASLVGKLSLTDRWVASQKFALVNLMSRELGARSSLGFESLPLQTQQMLGRYALDGKAWEVLRQARIADGELKGRITPESIRAMTDEQVKPLMAGDTPREAARVKLDLAMQYGALLNDHAGLAVGESNSRSRLAAYGTTTINDPTKWHGLDAWGVARRIMMQFHQAAMIKQQVLLRTYQNGGGSVSGASMAIQLALGSAALALMGDIVIDLFKGKDVPAPRATRMLEGTGLTGIAGDILANALSQDQPDKVSQVLGSGILGAGFGTVAKGVVASWKTSKGAYDWTQGKEYPGQYGGKYWAQTLQSLTPGQNLFYAKGAVDYMLMNGLHEFMGGGGYLDALRKQTNKQDAWPEWLGGEGGKQQFTFGGKNFWE